MVSPISLQQQEEDDQNRVFYELCTMIIHILGSPPLPIPFPSASLSSSPATFASLFLGISLALMVFGSVIFVIGFVLLPCVIGLLILFYFVHGLSNLWGAPFFRHLHHLKHGNIYKAETPHRESEWRQSVNSSSVLPQQ